MMAMKRRAFLQFGMGTILAAPLLGEVRSVLAMGLRKDKLDAAAAVLTKATAEGQVDAATLCVRQGKYDFVKAFGAAKSSDAMFLLGSISKTMSVAALMPLLDQGKFRLDDPVKKFLPEFSGSGREKVTVSQLLTHVSGLPDQLPENQALRSGHASLEKFAQAAMHTPLLFAPGTRYSYSSMAIMLAAEVAWRISGTDFLKLIDESVFQPLEMKHSALGLGRFKPAELMQCQVKDAAPESGAGDPAAKDWDWNSPYWRKLGAPWGGVHASAPDVAKFLAEFLYAAGKVVKPETARLMLRNHNARDLTPRGLGLAIGASSGSPGCSENTFGHSGSTGTLAWADPATETICVVLTTLPGRAAKPHPTKLVSDQVAQAAT
jgi:CubicO group peptidase (beta-lactamase class C family)